MVDAADLKSAIFTEVCGFESLPRHHFPHPLPGPHSQYWRCRSGPERRPLQATNFPLICEMRHGYFRQGFSTLPPVAPTSR